MQFSIATWNVNSINVRIEQLLEFLDDEKPDILCLQELKCEDNKFPTELFATLPYNLYIHGQKTYNGVAILSKIPADSVSKQFTSNPLPDQSRFIEIELSSPIGYCKVISLYAPNGGEVGSGKFTAKMDFYDAFIQYLESIKDFSTPIFVAGDFNIAPFTIDVYDPEHLSNSTCFTLNEQKKLRTILNSGFIDSYRIFHPKTKEFSWWDYRAGAFEQNKGMRIDTILASANAIKFMKSSKICYNFREKNKPSDHAPVITSFEI